MPKTDVILVGGGQIALWQMTESLEALYALQPTLANQAQQFAHPRRQKEWLSTRCLLQQMLPNITTQICYTSYRQPFLSPPSHHISISHSLHTVAILLHPKHMVGIDIEQIRAKIVRIQHKFLHRSELAQIQPNDFFTITLYWCVKEAVYKWYAKGAVQFNQDIIIIKVSSNNNMTTRTGTVTVFFKKGLCPQYLKVGYTCIGQQILAYIMATPTS